MSLQFRPVTQENWQSLIKLKVRDGQQDFVSSNVYSIAESHFGFEEEGHWDLFPCGLYLNDEPVGFAMTGLNFNHSRFQGLILRLMVDERYQGRGYGRQAMKVMTEMFLANEYVRRSVFRMPRRMTRRASSMRVLGSWKQGKCSRVKCWLCYSCDNLW